MDLLQATVLALALGGNSGTETVLLDFYADWCVPCRQMHPVVDRLAAMGYPVRKVNVDRQPDLAAKYGVSPIPHFIMLVDGRVVDQVVGATSFERLEQMCKAGMASRAANQAPAAAMPSSQPRFSPTNFSQTAQNGLANQPSREMSSPRIPEAPLIAATVRLRIRDASGHSCGSGTIIDARGGEALILTCGHIFRDSQGKGPIEVDVFGPSPAENLPGQLIAYDLETDIGLVAIRTPGPVGCARVATPGCRVTVGDSVANVGCSSGDPPSVRHSRVTALDRYLGPANLEVSGTPVEGRSGGGLFSAEGLLIGVCNAADPAENEGIYAALDVIFGHLDRNNLSFVYDRQKAPPEGVADNSPPSMPKEMPRTGEFVAVTGPAELLPSPVPWTGAAADPEPLRTEEVAALEEIRRRMGEGAEVICVIRSLSDPHAPSEILVLDRASPAFLQQLAEDAGARPSPQHRAGDPADALGEQRPRPAAAQVTSVRGGGGTPLHESSRSLPLPDTSRSDWEPRWLESPPAGQ